VASRIKQQVKKGHEEHRPPYAPTYCHPVQLAHFSIVERHPCLFLICIKDELGEMRRLLTRLFNRKASPHTRLRSF
jgi:hypothetical protein